MPGIQQTFTKQQYCNIKISSSWLFSKWNILYKRLGKYGQDENRYPCLEANLGPAEGQHMDQLEGANGTQSLSHTGQNGLEAKHRWDADRAKL